MKTIKQILTEARDLISDPDRWIQGTLASTATGESCLASAPDACRWCADGALYKVIGGSPVVGQFETPEARAVHDAACTKLQDATGKLFPYIDFVNVNDGRDHEGVDVILSRNQAHANILKVFDTAIAAEA